MEHSEWSALTRAREANVGAIVKAKVIVIVVTAVCMPVVCSAPAPAQVAPSRPADACQPIGRTEDGKLVYSLKCTTLPAPPKPSPAAGAEPSAPAAAAEEEDRGGLFGRAPSFIRPTLDPRTGGAGPSQPR
jgi:hypothetical protein